MGIIGALVFIAILLGIFGFGGVVALGAMAAIVKFGFYVVLVLLALAIVRAIAANANSTPTL
jgi:hypothetical protein